MARRGKKIDTVHWSGFTGVATALSAGTLGIIVATGLHTPETILRTRGTVVATLDGAQPPGVGVNIGIGMHLVQQGVGSGVSTSPLTDPDANWFFYTSFALLYEEMVIDVISAQIASAYREVIDSKAMRKLPQSTDVQMVIENATITGLLAGTVNVFVDGRVLSGT